MIYRRDIQDRRDNDDDEESSWEGGAGDSSQKPTGAEPEETGEKAEGSWETTNGAHREKQTKQKKKKIKRGERGEREVDEQDEERKREERELDRMGQRSAASEGREHVLVLEAADLGELELLADHPLREEAQALHVEANQRREVLGQVDVGHAARGGGQVGREPAVPQQLLRGRPLQRTEVQRTQEKRFRRRAEGLPDGAVEADGVRLDRIRVGRVR